MIIKKDTTKKVQKNIYEKDIQNDICKYLEAQGFFFWRSNNVPVHGRNNAGERTFRSLPKYTPKGIPDIMVLIDGEFIGIEVKRPQGTMRPDQIIFGGRIEENGGHYLVATSVEVVKTFIGQKIYK
jgi:hypothetical protein